MGTTGNENNQNAKRSFICECTKSAFVSGDTVSLEFIWPGPIPEAGQFFLLKPRRSGVFLGRPICASGWKLRKPSASGKPHVSGKSAAAGKPAVSWVLRFLITRRGQGSKELTEIRPGEEVELTGPLGNFWPTEHIPKGPVALVGGGVGIAPLLPLAQKLKKRPFDFYAGFGTGPFGLESIKPRTLVIATEDGSKGKKGRILDFFSPAGYSGIFACGPDSMIKALAKAARASGVSCYVSTGRLMACGVGACLGCKINTTRGRLRCCADGPIFNTEELIFDD